MRFFSIVILHILICATVCGQTKTPQLKTRQQPLAGLYIEKFQVLATDTSVKQGDYSLIYKGDVIEHGKYRKGERVGVWEFYNIHKKIELCYDYDQNLPFNIMPHNGYVYNARNFPSIFLGSPMVPYHFIMKHTYYPIKESENETDCKVVLALEINAQGRMTGFHLEQKSRDTFNNAVISAAEKIPKSWRWVPARKDGRNVESLYKMTLIFEAVD